MLGFRQQILGEDAQSCKRDEAAVKRASGSWHIALASVEAQLRFCPLATSFTVHKPKCASTKRDSKKSLMDFILPRLAPFPGVSGYFMCTTGSWQFCYGFFRGPSPTPHVYGPGLVIGHACSPAWRCSHPCSRRGPQAAAGLPRDEQPCRPQAGTAAC